MATQFEQALLRSAAYNALSLAFLYPEGDAGAVMAEKLRNLAAGALSVPWPGVIAAAEAADLSLQGFSPQDMQDAFLAIFGHTVPVDCPPYEAEYDQAHLFQKSQTLADVAAAYAAFGVSPSAQFRDRQDHLSMEMAFMDLLTFKEAYAVSQGHGEDAVAICRKGQETFLVEHLSTWAKTFAQRVERKSGPDNPYLYFVRLLDAFIDEECAGFDVTPLNKKAAVGAGLDKPRATPLTTVAAGGDA